ncbi:hypothetical protein KKF91_18915 [Myxococcota bacterium]|nr:hypothetical protein [Myxococcota bacterium]MBU1432616.1 hypothetical protein [Myxococcota bacterium]MBU1899521.1 hypothetical protein [Myxococcota bacterium]
MTLKPLALNLLILAALSSPWRGHATPPFMAPSSSPTARALRLSEAEFHLEVPHPEGRALRISFEISAASFPSDLSSPELSPLDVYLTREALFEVLATQARRTLRLDLRFAVGEVGRDQAEIDQAEIAEVVFLDERRPIASSAAYAGLNVRLGRVQGPPLSPALQARVVAAARGCWVSLAEGRAAARLNGALILALHEGPPGQAAWTRVVVDGLVYPKLTRCVLAALRGAAPPFGPPTLLPVYFSAP